jgi:hypothetical protein
MPKRSRKAPDDYNVNAARIVAIATGTEPPKTTKPLKPPAPKKNPHAVALGRKGGKVGGKVGGKARAKALTAEERHSIAVKAARARWGEFAMLVSAIARLGERASGGAYYFYRPATLGSRRATFSPHAQALNSSRQR